ncbi:MAG: NAD(P)-dependent oxidoreductase [Planctomycetota bacterium]
MHVVLTGAAGRLGRSIAVHLAAVGHTVTALDVRYHREPAQTAGVDFHVADLRDPSAIYAHLPGADALIHFGNQPNEHAAPRRQVYHENCVINLHTFEAAVEVGTPRIVFASSIQVQSGNRWLTQDNFGTSHLPALPVTGDAPPEPSNLYGLSKLAAEQHLTMLCGLHPELSAVSLRLPYTSPGPQAPHRVDVEAIRKHRKRRWSAPIDECFTWLDIAELGPLLDAILQHATPGHDVLLPTSNDNLLGWPLGRIAESFFPGTPLLGDPEVTAQRMSLADNGPITAKYGWSPAALPADQDAVAPTG